MHPQPLFHDADEDRALDEAEAIGFAHIFAAAPDPIVAHAPIVRTGQRAIGFHLATRNRLTAHLDGARVVASVAGPHGYVTPNWYGDPVSQVPTWNYLAFEIEGVARRMAEAELVAQLDRLAAVHEPGLSPIPWTRAKTPEPAFRKLLGAITGFEIAVACVRTTRKFSQNKPAGDRAGVAAGLARAGNVALAERMREATA